MSGISSFAFFCEDVRREASGKETFIGVMADVMHFSALPGKVRRLQVYYRIRFEVGKTYNQIIIPSVELDGNPVEPASPHAPLPLEMIGEVLKRAEKRGQSYVTVAARVHLPEPFPVQAPGQMLAFLNIDEEKMPCGALTFVERSDPSKET
jgi:hypothetical protein